VDPSQEFDFGLVIGGASLDDQLARDLTGLNLSHDPALQPPVEFVTAFTSCTTILRGATWNCQQLRFIFDEKRLDSVACYLSNSFDLVFLQEIPPGDSGQYRLRQLVRTMNAGSPLNEPGFSYLLGRETVVLDTTSQLNAIIYPTSWKILHHASLTSFLHPPIMAWFKKPESGSSSTTILAASFHISPSVGLASSSSASQEPGIPSTPSKSTSTASQTTVQDRLYLHLSKIMETAKEWEVSVPTPLDQRDLSPRWIIGGDLNVVPDSLPHGLVYTTPKGMPTAIASERTLDGFLVDPLTARTHNTVVDLIQTDPSLSDHHLVSLLLKEYV